MTLAESEYRNLRKSDKIKRLLKSEQFSVKEIALYFDVASSYISQLKKVIDEPSNPRGRPKKVTEDVIEEMIAFIELEQSRGNCPTYGEVTDYVSAIDFC